MDKIMVHGGYSRNSYILPPHVEWKNIGNEYRCEEFNVTVEFGVGGYYPDSAREIINRLTVRKKFPHLEDRIEKSIVLKYRDGYRRYFPLKAKKKKNSLLALREAYFIINGIHPLDKNQIKWSLFYQQLDHYIEKVEGKLMVRTIAL